MFSVTLLGKHSFTGCSCVCVYSFVLGTFLRYPSYTHTKTKRVNSGILNHSTQGLRECVCVCVLDNEDSHDFAERSEDSRGNLNESKNGKTEGWGF